MVDEVRLMLDRRRVIESKVVEKDPLNLELSRMFVEASRQVLVGMLSRALEIAYERGEDEKAGALLEYLDEVGSDEFLERAAYDCAVEGALPAYQAKPLPGGGKVGM
jgi:hypothetical protein